MNIKKTLFAATAFLLSLSSLFAQEKRDWANFGRYTEANESLSQFPKVVFMGNSITDAWPRNSPEFFADNNYAGRGISGQTSSEMLVRFRPDVIDLNPQAVVILAGTNDVAENNGRIELKYVLGNIISMAELAKANGIKVILCSVLPAYEFLWRKELEPAEKIKELNVAIKRYANASGFQYVDYHSAMADSRGGLPESLAADGVHPNKEGYAIMERLVQEAILSVLK